MNDRKQSQVTPVAAGAGANREPPSLGTHLQYVWEHGMHRLLRLAPLDVGSALGGAVVRFSVPRNRPWIIEGARRNLQRLRPDASAAEVEAMIQTFLDNVGRLMAEFSTLHRLVPAGRVTIEGADATLLHVARPLVALVLHTGNWEVLAAVLTEVGARVSSFYAPPETRAQREIAQAIRRRFGIRLLDPSPFGLHDAITRLSEGETIAIFGDEARDGRIMAPLFGRPPHARGNLSIAAYLARAANADIVVAHCVRARGSNFHVTVRGPMALPPVTGAKPDRLADVMFLNDIIEPTIRAHLDQWYFLDDAL